VTIFTTAVHLQSDSRDLETTQYGRLVLKTNADEILAVAPAGSIIMGGDNGLLHHLQFMRDYTLFDLNTYNENYNKNRIENWKKQFDSGDPQGLDPGRVQASYERLKDFDQKTLDEQQRKTILASLAAGHHVYVLESPTAKRRDKVPRQMADLVRKLTNNKTGDASQTLYADVVRRWRILVTPAAAQLGKEDKDNRRQPRLVKATVKPITYETPWLMYEVSAKELPQSAERKAILEYEAEQKTKVEQAAADRAATEKAKQLAEAKRREDEQQKRVAEQKARAAEQQKLAEAQRDLQAKLSAAKAQLDQTVAARATAEKQLVDLKTQQQATAEAVKLAAAEQAKTQDALAVLKDQQAKLAASIADGKSQLSAVQQKLEAARSELRAMEVPATQPTTVPSSE